MTSDVNHVFYFLPADRCLKKTRNLYNPLTLSNLLLPGWKLSEVARNPLPSCPPMAKKYPPAQHDRMHKAGSIILTTRKKSFISKHETFFFQDVIQVHFQISYPFPASPTTLTVRSQRSIAGHQIQAKEKLIINASYRNQLIKKRNLRPPRNGVTWALHLLVYAVSQTECFVGANCHMLFLHRSAWVPAVAILRSKPRKDTIFEATFDRQFIVQKTLHWSSRR